MSHRTDRVRLAASEPRCEPANPCRHKLGCKRYLAALPQSGASMIGAGLPVNLWGAYCPSYLPLSGDQADTVKRKVHPPIGE
jgi:hypothetical protein